MEKRRNFPDWEQLYRNEKVESMPWYHPELDPDFEQALNDLNIDSGTVWDLGSGPGTQAMALAERGFKVTATDISKTAIKDADILASKKGLNIEFIHDNTLNCKLEKKFDFVFDRGCFNVFEPEERQKYVDIVSSLINPKGYLFIKCFSHLETREEGPYRFSPEQIKIIFSPKFKICSIKETVYQGTLEKFPQALFCVLQKNS